MQRQDAGRHPVFSGSNVSNGAYPLRVLYSVGLIDGVTDQNGILNDGVVSDDYANAHTDEDGNLLFYSNKYSGNTDNGWNNSQADNVTVGDAYVEFTPASDNPFYYVQDNTDLYLDEDCTQPATGELSADTTYYFRISYYDAVGSGAQTAVVERPGSEMDSSYVSATGENGQLQLQEGAPRLGYLSDFVRMKEDTGLTNTADSAYYPTYQGDGVFRVYLGNNGVLPVRTAMENTKDVVEPGTDTSIDGQLVGVGDQLEYVINWVNDATDASGQFVAAEVKVTDQVPDGTRFISAENGGTEENGTVTWNLGTQEAGAVGTVRFTVEVTEDAVTYDSIQNTASIQLGENDPGTTNTVTNYVPEKEVSGTDSDGNASVGDTLTYTISWRNTETASANVTIVDVLDEGLNYIENSANPNATYDAETDTLTWVIENAEAGAQGTVTFQAQVNENALNTTVENQATVQIGNQAAVSTNPVETPVNPDNPGGTTGDVDVTLSGTKTMTGRTLQSSDQFQFTIEAVNGAPLPEQTTVTNDGGSIAFGPIHYTQAGQYEYTIRETGGSAAGVTSDSGTVRAVVTVSQNSESGALTYEVSYEKQGGNGGEGFTFVNVYQPSPTSAVGGFEAVKTVEASEGNSYTMTGGEFSFSITPSSENPDSDPVQAATVTNGADGSVVLSSPVQYTEAGTYRYTVQEENSTVGGITKDNSVYIITVVVTEDTANAVLSADMAITKDGQEVSGISFTNTYDPARTGVSFGGTKVLNGGTLEEGAFSFTLTATSGADTPMPQDGAATVTNNAAGTYRFGEIIYTQPGTYTYQISEVDQGAKGYTYDHTTYTVQVTVTDEDGVLKEQVTGADDMVFTNTYQPESVTLSGETAIQGTKVLNGRTLADGEFTFVLQDQEGNVVAETTNGSDGTFRFEGLTYETPQDVTYTVAERADGAEGITYDTSVYTVHVHVEDADGYLTAAVSYEDTESMVFTNTYEEPETPGSGETEDPETPAEEETPETEEPGSETPEGGQDDNDQNTDTRNPENENSQNNQDNGSGQGQTSGDTKSDTVKTGDDAPIVQSAAAMAVSLGVIIALRKRQK